jgi:hypothetical protein
MKSISKALVAVALSSLLVVALVANAASAATGAAATATASAACTPKTNIEAIVDDSGSMTVTDPNTLRVQAMDLLIHTLPSSTTLGAVEFGSGIEGIPGVFEGIPAASTIFPPEAIAPNAAAMEASLKTNIKADNGATDYNGAFAKADADNKESQARIFLTDGGHDVGTYSEAHLAHNVPTYVIGFGGITLPEDKSRLEKIASDTGGKVYELEDSSEIQAVVNSIGAELTCKTPPRAFTDELGQGETSKQHTLTIGKKTHLLRVTLTWAEPGDHFKLTGLAVKSHGKIVAAAVPKGTPKLTVIPAAGSSTFSVFKVGHLRPGTLQFAVKGTKVSGGTVKVTTQLGGEEPR